MKRMSLVIYFVLLSLLWAAFIIGAKRLGEQGVYLVQVYILTAAMAALIVRFFFYKPMFKDANFHLGKIWDYFKFWLVSLGITTLSYGIYTLLGATTWDFIAQRFLDNLAQQFVAMGQEINDTLPPGFTPKMMLWIFFFGGLTVFIIMPGIITGFGEEFGHRGFLFPQIHKIKPWVGIIIGGLIWYAWHLPLVFILLQKDLIPSWQTVLNFIILGIGSVCTFTYLAYVYVKSESIWITSLAHITMNNAAASFVYFVTIQNQLLANLGLSLTMVIVVSLLFYKKQNNFFAAYFDCNPAWR